MRMRRKEQRFGCIEDRFLGWLPVRGRLCGGGAGTRGRHCRGRYRDWLVGLPKGWPNVPSDL